MRREIIDAVKAAGFDVYMQDQHKDTWMIFTDGKSLGYLQDGWRGISTSTVHKANRTTGTGYQIDEFILLSELTTEKLSHAFTHSPAWASSSDRASVVKYKSIDEYKRESTWNATYAKVE